VSFTGHGCSPTTAQGYLSADLAKWLDDRKMQHVRGAPYHPMTQGKIERWHQTLKNRILLENYYLPGELEAKIGDFVAYYNHLRYHERHRQSDTGRRLLRTWPDHPLGKRKDQTTHHREPTLELPPNRRLTSLNRCARASLPHKPVLTLFI